MEIKLVIHQQQKVKGQKNRSVTFKVAPLSRWTINIDI